MRKRIPWNVPQTFSYTFFYFVVIRGLVICFFFLRLYTNIFFFLPTSQQILGQVTEHHFEKHEGLHSFEGLESNRL